MIELEKHPWRDEMPLRIATSVYYDGEYRAHILSMLSDLKISRYEAEVFDREGDGSTVKVFRIKGFGCRVPSEAFDNHRQARKAVYSWIQQVIGEQEGQGEA